MAPSSKVSKLYLLIPLCFLFFTESYFRLFPSHEDQERTLRTVLFKHLESTEKKDILLLGSSIFANFIDEAYPRISNLSFDGGNALTGLSIVKDQMALPKVMIIEMGLNTLAQSQGIHADIYSMYENRHFTLWRRSILHCSRRENNLHSKFRTLARNHSTEKKVRGLLPPPSSWYNRALRQYLSRQETRNSIYFYKQDLVKNWILQQKELIDFFIKQGVKVVLLRCPEAPEMRQARQQEYQVEETHFPLDRYEWLDPQASGEAFATTDGIHLLRDDSIRVMGIILEYLFQNPDQPRFAHN